jgi:hypothetical protein
MELSFLKENVLLTTSHVMMGQEGMTLLQGVNLGM